MESDESGHWTCHREGRPELSCGGAFAEIAFHRCCEAYGIDGAKRRVGGSYYGRRIELLVADVCSDCGGSGQYVGLNLTEQCATCKGSGNLLNDPIRLRRSF
jgi:DnaJ-class molecular chaperone